jgi:hypothetical protein
MANAKESSTVESLILDFLEWLAVRDRSYEEVMDAWRTSYPRLPVWEEANERGLVMESRGRHIIRPSSSALALIERRRRVGAAAHPAI